MAPARVKASGPSMLWSLTRPACRQGVSSQVTRSSVPNVPGVPCVPGVILSWSKHKNGPHTSLFAAHLLFIGYEKRTLHENRRENVRPPVRRTGPRIGLHLQRVYEAGQ